MPEKAEKKGTDNDLREAIKHIARSPEGRRYLAKLINDCRVFDFNPDPGNGFFDGARSVGLRILSDVKSVDEGSAVRIIQRCILGGEHSE